MYTEPDSWTWMPLGSFLRGLGIYHPMRHADRLDGALPHPLDDFRAQEPSFRPGTAFRKWDVRDRAFGYPPLNRALTYLEGSATSRFVRMSPLLIGTPYDRPPSPPANSRSGAAGQFVTDPETGDRGLQDVGERQAIAFLPRASHRKRSE